MKLLLWAIALLALNHPIARSAVTPRTDPVHWHHTNACVAAGTCERDTVVIPVNAEQFTACTTAVIYTARWVLPPSYTQNSIADADTVIFGWLIVETDSTQWAGAALSITDFTSTLFVDERNLRPPDTIQPELATSENAVVWDTQDSTARIVIPLFQLANPNNLTGTAPSEYAGGWVGHPVRVVLSAITGVMRRARAYVRYWADS